MMNVPLDNTDASCTKSQYDHSCLHYLLSFPSPNFFSCPLKAPLPAWSTFLFLYLQTGFSAYYSFPSEHVL